MKVLSVTAGLLGVVAVVSLAGATVIDARLTYENDSTAGDGAIVLQPTTSVGWTAASVSTDAVLSQVRSPGQYWGDVTSDSPTLDPIVNSVNRVTNDTTFAWASYIINIYMNKEFNLDSASTPLVGWNTFYVPGPADGVLGGQSHIDQDGRKWDFMAAVQYSTLDPSKYVQIGGTGEFDVTFSWAGSTVYQLELIPVAPEPASLALLALGGLFIRRHRR